MKKLMLVFAVTLLGAIANAGTRADASEICNSMDFDSGKNACISKISSYEYYDNNAISVCKGMDFDSGKSSCIDAIGDKSYETYETNNCGGMDFDSEKLKCLTSTGRKHKKEPISACLSKKQILAELNRISDLVYQGRNNQAQHLIYDLSMDLRKCP